VVARYDRAWVISEREEQAVLGRAAKVLAVSGCIQAVSWHDETPAYAAMAANRGGLK